MGKRKEQGCDVFESSFSQVTEADHSFGIYKVYESIIMFEVCMRERTTKKM